MPAAQFMAEVEDEPQEVMARWTGNYRRGNERAARNTPATPGGVSGDAASSASELLVHDSRDY